MTDENQREQPPIKPLRAPRRRQREIDAACPQRCATTFRSHLSGEIRRWTSTCSGGFSVLATGAPGVAAAWEESSGSEHRFKRGGSQEPCADGRAGDKGQARPGLGLGAPLCLREGVYRWS